MQERFEYYFFPEDKGWQVLPLQSNPFWRSSLEKVKNSIWLKSFNGQGKITGVKLIIEVEREASDVSKG